MILRKPYAFFMKVFRPIHLLLAFALAYLIYLSSKLLGFFNEYMYSSSTGVTSSIKSIIKSNLLYIIPIVLIAFSLLFFGIMFRKKKPYKFYLINIFAFIGVIIINLYTTNLIATLEENLVSIKIIKLMHDLVVISLIIQSLSFVFMIIRGTGVDFKKFSFDNTVSKFNINEEDREEFEINVNVDFNESKANRKRFLRNLKYFFQERKLLIIISSIVVLAATLLLTLYFIFNDNTKKEGIYYNVSTFNIKVNNTIYLNENYKGDKITDNYLVIVNASLSSAANKSINMEDFSLNIGDVSFKTTNKYSNYLLDLGNVYNSDKLTSIPNDYLLVFEIPLKYTTSTMNLNYGGSDGITIRLSPKKLNISDTQEIREKILGEEVSLKDSLGDVNFKINSVDLDRKFTINYDYCVDDICVNSVEYLKPSIDKNFDKIILKLDLEFNNNSKVDLSSFYDLLSKFGYIYYEVNGIGYYQVSGFEKITSNKSKNENIEYIGVDSDILSATKIKFVFSIRDYRYDVIIKGDE